MGAMNIISRSSRVFTSRAEAALLLADKLGSFRQDCPVILGIPRGGVIIAHHLARELECDLDVVLAHKLGAPANRELAIGAVCEGGTCFVDEEIALELMSDRIDGYRRILPKTDLAGRVAILTDDGVATGATMKAALWAVRQDQPKRIIAALPVGPSDTIELLAEVADEVICLETPPYFAAIGQFYVHFDQVDNDEILEILRHERDRRCRA